jgi:methyl-accepting chemotaxis protein
VAEIASASQEQSTGIDQINKALNQMDDVTQQNSALVEENAATAKTLEHQSDTMNEKVAFFRLDDRASSQTIKTPAPAFVTRLTAKPTKPESRRVAQPRPLPSRAGARSRPGPLSSAG